MSDETYYTVLNVKETASPSEIKTAYRDLIKQVHPDTIATLAPYLRKIAEEKAKEITEAYGVLSNSSKRRDYDNQLATYRRQNAPQAAPTPQAPPTPPPPQQHSQCPVCGRSDGGHSSACANSRTSQSTSSGPYCNTCGTSLYASGYCPKCSKFATPSATTGKPAATPKVIRRFGYNWGPLLDWAGEHPLLVVFLFLVGVFSIGALFSDSNTQPSASSSSATPSSASPTPFTNNAKAASTGPYSAYPCDHREKVSSIDGKPCKERQNDSIPAPPPGFTVVSEEPAPPKPTVTVSGTYLGTVHNQTVNTSSSFAAVIRQAKGGVLDGCMKVEPPLYGSGVLQGGVSGSHVNFSVADITFQGDASKGGIAGSYVVTRHDGNQLGDFRLTKQTASNTSYACSKGEVTKFEVVDAVPSQHLSDVPRGYSVPPPAANSTPPTPDPPERRAGLKQPDFSSLTSSERQSLESACSYAKYNQGPAAYDQCLVLQFDRWTAGPKQPDLSALASPERQSMESACSYAKYNLGPAAYNQCLIRQLQEWTAGPKRPDLSSLNHSERQSIESACSYAKYNQGPAAYNRCLVRQLEALKNYRQ